MLVHPSVGSLIFVTLGSFPKPVVTGAQPCDVRLPWISDRLSVLKAAAQRDPVEVLAPVTSGVRLQLPGGLAVGAPIDDHPNDAPD
ncbi:MAG: hypothetical protein ACI81R_001733 [Bradymonadia bacterium]|jgi:hypothetical protein